MVTLGLLRPLFPFLFFVNLVKILQGYKNYPSRIGTAGPDSTRTPATKFGDILESNNLSKIENLEKYFYVPRDHLIGHISYKY